MSEKELFARRHIGVRITFIETDDPTWRYEGYITEVHSDRVVVIIMAVSPTVGTTYFDSRMDFDTYTLEEIE